jgi:antitoxin YefM
MRTIQFDEAQATLASVLDQAKVDADVTFIERDGEPVGVLMCPRLYHSLMDTMHLLSSPANVAHLAASVAQARSGGAIPRSLIDPDKPQQVTPATS